MKRLVLPGLLLAAAAVAGASDSFKDIANFESGKVTLAVRTEIRADGDRRGILRMDDYPKAGGVLIYRPQDWTKMIAAVTEAIAVAGRLPAGGTRPIADVVSTGGGFLRVEAVAPGGQAALRFTRLDGPGGKYPAVVFLLPAADFPRLQRAVEDVAKEFTATKLNGYY